MSEHTQGRLVVRGGYSIYTTDGTPVADTCLTASIPDNDETNARRLVACWNACEPIADPENVVPRLLALNERVPELEHQAANLRNQFDELLGAAIAAEEALRYLGGTLHADRVRTAIAKAAGEKK